MALYQYYEKGAPPFRVLSDLSFQDATGILERLRIEPPHAQLASRPPDYTHRRLNCERMLQETFLKNGGMIQHEDPYYMTLGHSPWLSTWFDECVCIRIPAEKFDLRTVSFTYGDSHPPSARPFRTERNTVGLSTPSRRSLSSPKIRPSAGLE